MSSKLLNKVMDLLDNTDKKPSEIAVGAQVGYPWLMALKGRHGTTKFPSVDKVERLYEYLSGRKLEI
jgi:hypothetical protein